MSKEIIPTPSIIATRGGLAVYGPGSDGDVTIVGTVVLTRDMYYNNLTLLANAQLDTNGFRVFVKDTLHLADPTCVIGRLSNTTSTGTLMGGAPTGVKASDTLGGNGGLNPGENFFGEAEFYNFSQAIAGYKFDAVTSTIKFLMGGSGGLSGTDGEAGASGTGNSGDSGAAGSVGSPGGQGNPVGTPGGQGYSGNPGNPGNPGVGGSGGAGGTKGIGGAGGGVVIISARNITGYGIIRADGKAPIAPTEGLPGAAGTPGNPGNAGNPGSPAPDFFQAAYTYIVSNAYNYNVLYNFINPATPAANYGNSPYYYVTSPSSSFFGYISGTRYYNYVSAAQSFGTNPSYVKPGNATPATPNPPNPPTNPTLGPASVRYRQFVAGNPTAPRPNPPNPPTFIPSSYNVYNYFVSGTNSAAYSYPFNIFNQTQYGFAYYTNTYNYAIAGNPGSSYYAAFSPQVDGYSPSIFSAGGAGGAGGAAGAGGTASAGLPGSPGTAGYAGGGGVVLIISKTDIPNNIEVRAAAGTGDGGVATAGTVIIIKNEENQ